MSVPTTKAEFVRCRTIGHSWDTLPHTPGKPVIRLRCTSCAMERFDTVEVSTGEVRSRKYDAPSGYYLTKNSPTDKAPRKDEWRHEFLIVSGIVNKAGKVR